MLKFFVFLVLLIFSIWLIGFGSFAFDVINKEPIAPDQSVDAIVVVTGGKYRIATGLDLLSKKRAPRLFISGVHPDTKMSDLVSSEIYNDYAECCIILGRKATTTQENALEIQAWAQSHEMNSMQLVTSDYHMDRAIFEINTLMPDVEILPYPVEKKDYTIQDLKFWTLAFEEYNKIIYRYSSRVLNRFQNTG